MGQACVCRRPILLSSVRRPGVPTTISGLFCFSASACTASKHQNQSTPKQEGSTDESIQKQEGGSSSNNNDSVSALGPVPAQQVHSKSAQHMSGMPATFSDSFCFRTSACTTNAQCGPNTPDTGATLSSICSYK